MSDDDPRVLRIRPGATAWTAAGDEAVVLDLQRSAYVGLNETASFLWQRLVEGSTQERLVEALMGEYDVDDATAGSEVSRFVADLRGRGYLEQV